MITSFVISLAFIFLAGENKKTRRDASIPRGLEKQFEQNRIH
jgi:hypothetical protein